MHKYAKICQESTGFKRVRDGKETNQALKSRTVLAPICPTRNISTQIWQTLKSISIVPVLQ